MHLCSDFVELAEATRLRENADRILQEHQRSLTNFEAAAAAEDTGSAQTSVIKDMVDMAQSQRDHFADQEETIEARLLDLTAQITAGVQALDDLAARKLLQDPSAASQTPTVQAVKADDSPSLPEDHWTKATKEQFKPGNYPTSAPTWLTNELTDLRTAVNGARNLNADLSRQVKDAHTEIANLRHELSRRPGFGSGGRSLYIAPTPGSGSHGSNRGNATEYGGGTWGGGDGAATPKFNPSESTWNAGGGAATAGDSSWGAPSGADSSWGAEPATAASDSWDAPASSKRQSAQMDSWSVPASVNTTAAAQAQKSAGDKSPSATQPSTAQDSSSLTRRPSAQRQSSSSSATHRQSTTKKQSGGVNKKIDQIDLAALDPDSAFGGHQAQLAVIRDIARKVSDYQVTSYHLDYAQKASDHRKQQIVELGAKFQDLRRRTLQVEDHLHLPHPTDPGLPAMAPPPSSSSTVLTQSATDGGSNPRSQQRSGSGKRRMSGDNGSLEQQGWGDGDDTEMADASAGAGSHLGWGAGGVDTSGGGWS